MTISLRIDEVEETRGQIINLASGKEITIKKLIEEIIKISGYKGSIDDMDLCP